MRLPYLTLSAAVAATLVGSLVWGCTDLFHSTDFGDAGTPVPPPPADVDFCSWDSTTALGHAVESCTRLIACESGFGTGSPSAVGECVKNALQAYDCTIAPNRPVQRQTQAFWQCLWKARTCSSDPQGLNTLDCVYPGAFLCGNSDYTTCGQDAGTNVRVQCQTSGSTGLTDPCVSTGRTCDQANTGGLCTGS
ncbi:MAG TPA: hypothetical protein VNO21_22625, partial [Polyangiaceae bacterium]|nr:hypothetical protein [Polyangiaceae bacterium]